MCFKAEMAFVSVINEGLQLPLPVNNPITHRDGFHFAGIGVCPCVLEVRVDHRRLHAIVGIGIGGLAALCVCFIGGIPDTTDIRRINLLNKFRCQFGGAQRGRGFVFHAEDDAFAVYHPARFIVGGDNVVPTFLSFTGVPKDKSTDEIGIKRLCCPDTPFQYIKVLFPFFNVVHIAFKKWGCDADNLDVGAIKEAFHLVDVGFGEFVRKFIPDRTNFDGVEVEIFHKIDNGGEVLRDFVADNAEFKHSYRSPLKLYRHINTAHS